MRWNQSQPNGWLQSLELSFSSDRFLRQSLELSFSNFSNNLLKNKQKYLYSDSIHAKINSVPHPPRPILSPSLKNEINKRVLE